MKRACVAVTVILLGVLGTPIRSEAGLLSWLDRLSGPGPFWGVDFSVPLRCPSAPPPGAPPSTEGFGIIVSCRYDDLTKKQITWYLDTGVAATFENPLDYGERPGRAPSTGIGLLKFGTSVHYRVDRLLDIGVGGGFLYFGGPSFVNFARPYVQPLRVTFRPLLLGAPGGKDPKLQRRGWLIINFDLNVTIGTISASDFGAPADPWRSHNELVPGFGVSVDVTKLLKKP